MSFLNKRFVPFTDEGRYITSYGVYDNAHNCKIILNIQTWGEAAEKARALNKNLELIPEGLQLYDQHLPATGSHPPRM